MELDAALASAIAQVGAPSGVRALLDEVARNAPSIAALDRIEANDDTIDQRWEVAYLQLKRFRNPDGLPVLEVALRGADSSGVERYAAGEALSSTVLPEAFEILLRWAANTTAADADLATRWFSRIRDPRSAQLVSGVLQSMDEKPVMQFSDPVVLQAVEDAVNQL